MTLEDAIKLAVLALAKTMEEPSPENIEVAVITVEEKKFKKISKEKVAKCLEEALKEAEEEEVAEKEEDYTELDSNY
ncbi:proteasome subunit alpha, partial [Thermococcus sp. ES12]|nr:proteasome subunit alpha [Thermococcus sp. ES12]